MSLLERPVHLEHDWYADPLPPGVTIGPDSWLYSSFAFVYNRSRRPAPVTVGSNCGIYMGTQFALGPEGEVELGDCTTLNGPVFTVNGRLEIGSHCLIGFSCVIADNPFWRPLQDDEQPPLGPNTVIGDNVWVAIRTRIRSGITIGDNAIIGLKAVVLEDVPAGAIVAGNPGRIVGWVQ